MSQSVFETLPDSIIEESLRGHYRLFVWPALVGPIAIALLCFSQTDSILQFTIILPLCLIVFAPFAMISVMFYFRAKSLHRWVAANKPTVSHVDGTIILEVGEGTFTAKTSDCQFWRGTVSQLSIHLDAVTSIGRLYCYKRVIVIGFPRYETLAGLGQPWRDTVPVGYTDEMMRKWENVLGKVD